MASRLPVEVVTHIMRFLSVSDRKDAGLVNRLWYEASLDPCLQRDIIIHFYASTASATCKSMPSLSKRRLPHLVINEFDLSLESKSVVLKSCEHLAANLQTLSLRGSNISEKTFVELLSQCKNLTSLDLSCCNVLFMSGQLLMKHEDLQLLQLVLHKVASVNLSSIRYLSDATFNRIVTVCPGLEKLVLASSPILFKGGFYHPPSVTHCANNSVLTFRNIMDFVITQQCLKSLNLSRTQIADEHLEEIASCSGLVLEELVLVACRNISDEGIASLCTNQPGLVTLDLGECQDLTNAAVKSIGAHLKALKHLNMKKCRQITDSGVSALKGLIYLQTLDFAECSQITSVGLLSGLTSVERPGFGHLSLNCCSLVCDNFVLQACESLPYLTHLDLGSCGQITDASVHAVSSHLKYLRYLRLSWCKITDLGLMGLETNDPDHITDDSFEKINSTIIFRKPTEKKQQSIVNKCVEEKGDVPDTAPLCNLARLQHLDLMSCGKLTDTSLTQVVKFPELHVLVLGMLPGLSNKGVIQIIQNNPSLEKLNLYQCCKLTDEAVDILSKKLSRLQELVLFGCDKLTDRSVHSLQMNCRLRHLDVSFCPGITMEAMDHLETHMKTLTTVHKRMINSAT